MTYQEALNQGINLSPTQARNDLERYLLREERPIPKSVALGMQALEKQIPKKPYKDNDNGIYEKDYCPSCHRSLFPNDHHCRCGQALDWSDTE